MLCYISVLFITEKINYMKNLMILLIAFVTLGSFQTQESKTKVISFPTTAICGECKERIENKLNYTKGIIYSELDLETKILTVKFKPALITEQQIKEVLANLGYSSDTVERNHEAWQALPKCCKGDENCEPKK